MLKPSFLKSYKFSIILIISIVIGSVIGLVMKEYSVVLKPFGDIFLNLFTQFLIAGNEVMTKAIGYVMLYAPVGLGAYFAYLVGVFGPQLFGTYLLPSALTAWGTGSGLATLPVGCSANF